MKKSLVIVAGSVMFLLTFLHVYLGWKIHGMTDLTPFNRALMEMLNIATGLFALFFGVTALFLPDDLMTTRVGKLVLLFGFIMMAGRSVGEIVIFPAFNATIFVVCAAVACLYGAAAMMSGSRG